jgi:hypothetical protein
MVFPGHDKVIDIVFVYLVQRGILGTAVTPKIYRPVPASLAEVIFPFLFAVKAKKGDYCQKQNPSKNVARHTSCKLGYFPVNAMTLENVLAGSTRALFPDVKKPPEQSGGCKINGARSSIG